MSRSGYADSGELDDWQLAMWRGRVASSIRGKRGQQLLRDLLAALDAMPAKRLIANDLVREGEACLLGVVGKARGVADLDTIDSAEDHHILAERLNVAECLVREIEWVNDEGNYRTETPEQRYERARKWVERQIRTEAVPV